MGYEDQNNVVRAVLFAVNVRLTPTRVARASEVYQQKNRGIFWVLLLNTTQFPLFPLHALAATVLIVINKQLLTGYSFKYGKPCLVSFIRLASIYFFCSKYLYPRLAAATLGGFHLSATAISNWLLGVTAGRARAEVPFRGAVQPS